MDFSGVFFLVGEISMEDISTNNPMSCYKKNHGSEDGIPYQPPGKDWDLETSKVSKMGKITCVFFFRWFLTFNHGKSPGWRAVLLHPDVFSQGNDRDEHPHNKSPQKTLERSHFWSMFTNFWSYIVTWNKSINSFDFAYFFLLNHAETDSVSYGDLLQNCFFQRR